MPPNFERRVAWHSILSLARSVHMDEHAVDTFLPKEQKCLSLDDRSSLINCTPSCCLLYHQELIANGMVAPPDNSGVAGEAATICD